MGARRRGVVPRELCEPAGERPRMFSVSGDSMTDRTKAAWLSRVAMTDEPTGRVGERPTDWRSAGGGSPESHRRIGPGANDEAGDTAR